MQMNTNSVALSARSEGAVTAPRTPEDVAAIIEAGVVERRMVFPESGGYRSVERWVTPTSVEPSAISAARGHLAELEAYLAPASRAAILGRVLVLLSHFRSEPNPPRIEALLADDWAEDLGPYPLWAVDAAARTWRKTRKFRPQICEMVTLCEEETLDAVRKRDRLRKIVLSDRDRGHGNASMAARMRGVTESLARGMR